MKQLLPSIFNVVLMISVDGWTGGMTFDLKKSVKYTQYQPFLLSQLVERQKCQFTHKVLFAQKIFDVHTAQILISTITNCLLVRVCAVLHEFLQFLSCWWFCISTKCICVLIYFLFLFLFRRSSHDLCVSRKFKTTPTTAGTEKPKSIH